MTPIEMMTTKMPIAGEEPKRFIYLFFLSLSEDDRLVLAVEEEFYANASTYDPELQLVREGLSRIIDDISELIFVAPEALKKEPLVFVALSEEAHQVAFKVNHPAFYELQDAMSELFSDIINKAFLLP